MGRRRPLCVASSFPLFLFPCWKVRNSGVRSFDFLPSVWRIIVACVPLASKQSFDNEWVALVYGKQADTPKTVYFRIVRRQAGVV